MDRYAYRPHRNMSEVGNVKPVLATRDFSLFAPISRIPCGHGERAGGL